MNKNKISLKSCSKMSSCEGGFSHPILVIRTNSKSVGNS